MPEIRVQDEQGTVHVFPDGSTPEMIAKVMNVRPPDAPAEDRGFLHALGSDLGGMVKGFPKAAASAAAFTLGVPAAAQRAVGLSPPQDAASAIVQNFKDRGAAGNSLPYRVGAAANEALGVNVRGEEESAKAGDVGGVLGHALAVPVAMAVTGGVAKGAQLAREALPSAARAGAALQEVKAVAGNVPIDTAKAGNSALELYTQADRGANLPPAVRKLVNRLAKPDSPPMTYAEAKDFQSNISSLSANEKMNLKPNTVRLLGQLNTDMKAALADAADTAGKGEQFTTAMKEYHNAMKLKGYSEAAISQAWKVALGYLGARELANIFSGGHGR